MAGSCPKRFLNTFCAWVNHSHGVQLRTIVFFFFLRFYLFIFREKGREGKKRSKTSMCACLLQASYWGHSLQPSHVPWLGIQPVTLWFPGPLSIHWATIARARTTLFHIFVLCTWFSWVESMSMSSLSHSKVQRKSVTRGHGIANTCWGSGLYTVFEIIS